MSERWIDLNRHYQDSLLKEIYVNTSFPNIR